MEFVVSEEAYKDIELPVTKENFTYKLMVIVDEHMEIRLLLGLEVDIMWSAFWASINGTNCWNNNYKW